MIFLVLFTEGPRVQMRTHVPSEPQHLNVTLGHGVHSAGRQERVFLCFAGGHSGRQGLPLCHAQLLLGESRSTFLSSELATWINKVG